jgi:hypothetical protein
MLQQSLDTRFADYYPEPPDLHGIARKFGMCTPGRRSHFSRYFS